MRRHWLLWAVIAVLVGVIGCRQTPQAASTPTPDQTHPPALSVQIPEEVPKEFKALWEAYTILSREYVDKSKIQPDILARGAIKGMLETLQDPHTDYLPPDRYLRESQDFRGSFSGIGAEVFLRNGRIILNPMPGSPAEKAGLRPGDIVLAVDGEKTDGWTVMQAVSRIRGPRGTPVRLTILHLGESEPVEVTIVRDIIRLESVFMNMMSDGVAYIRISAFYENTEPSFVQKVQEARQKGAKGIVLDLRNNPGGYLSVAVNITSHFLKSGLVVYEVDGNGRRTDWRVRPGGIATDIPLVVLVNQFSASGSEVVAGALQDHGRAQVVGTKTLGKGSVNLLRPLSDGGGLYYTYAHWYTPNGRLIEGQGLTPDVEVPAIARRGDPQLEKALEVLKQAIAATQG
ncbi:MAG: S41 family peptidase [Dehalococcoidia bacterium]|nr:S41 family peptidase [Dehalococcoidia bacterium]MDW8119273.1 S41 family peptidase [Chloroflexota bacterium]